MLFFRHKKLNWEIYDATTGIGFTKYTTYRKAFEAADRLNASRYIGFLEGRNDNNTYDYFKVRSIRRLHGEPKSSNH